MSLFGTSPTEDDNVLTSNRESKASSGGGLFDEPSHKSSSNSLFADDANNQDDSPWSMPTPRKQQSRANVIRSLLPASDVPESYITAFDTIVNLDGSGGKITADGVAKLFTVARISVDAQAGIMKLLEPATGGGEDVRMDRSEFHVLMALVGLAQEGETISLDGVDERKRDVPRPTLEGLNAEPVIEPIREPSIEAPRTPVKAQAPSPSRQQPRSTMVDPEDDPWNSPEVHKGHNHSEVKSNGANPTRHSESNGFHTATVPNIQASYGDHKNNSATRSDQSTSLPPPSASNNASSGWGEFPGNNRGIGEFGDAPPSNPMGGSFGGDGPGDGRPPASAAIRTSRSLGGRSNAASEEVITIQLMAEKEGVFMFQHHNYEVSSQRRGSKVVRRYSDFVWLLDCLQKRYPFRVLPLLPPKRVAVNGNHLSNDGAFMEKRRRGLIRFINAVVRHPLLSQEQLVIMFLTVPTELAVWRKQATISVQDEFTDKAMPPDLEETLPSSLEELFSRARAGVRRSAELYINVCNIMDRLVKRTEGVAADHGRVALLLASLTETSADVYATDTNEVPLLNDGLMATSKHLQTCQAFLEDESRGWDEGVLEDLKRQRDALVSVRELFERRERLDKDNIPYLERRIQTNETKLASLRAKPEGTVKPGEIEKVAENIIKDKESIVQQHNRSIFVKECIRDELINFQNTQYHVSRWNQDWAGERVKYAEMLADNWRRLLDGLEGMPLGD